MRTSLLQSITAAGLAAMAAAAPAEGDCNCGTKAPAFFLAGDSTTAIQLSNDETHGGGWGNGFLALLKPPAWGINYGHNGATTASFVSMGDWGRVIADVKNNTAKYTCFVTIQFGHNDQKPAANLTLSQYQANLQRLANEARAAGATPILLSSLTRRNFSPTNNSVDDSLYHERLATQAAAKATGTRFLDLNAASMAFINSVGRGVADKYNLEDGDRTHLNAHGSVVFGRMVADLLLGHYPTSKTPVGVCETEDKFPVGCLTPWIAANQSMTDAIWNGVAV